MVANSANFQPSVEKSFERIEKPERAERPATSHQPAYAQQGEPGKKTAASSRFIAPKPAEVEEESESGSNVASFPSDKVVSARQQYTAPGQRNQGQRAKKGGFFERAARSFGFSDNEEEQQRRRPAAGRERVKVDSEEDYYEIPAYMRRKSSGE